MIVRVVKDCKEVVVSLRSLPELCLNLLHAATHGHKGTVTEAQLHDIVSQYLPSLSKPWPSDRDVLRAFKVFDSEGLGFIKVTLLKRFLVQAQLDVEDSVCKQFDCSWC